MNQNSARVYRLPANEIETWVRKSLPRPRPIAQVIVLETRRTPPLHGKNWKVPIGPNRSRR
ncbi:MAG: hypothetical protein WCK01_01185 [Candidatus Uhrbacteria bacterium]